MRIVNCKISAMVYKKMLNKSHVNLSDVPVYVDLTPIKFIGGILYKLYSMLHGTTISQTT